MDHQTPQSLRAHALLAASEALSSLTAGRVAALLGAFFFGALVVDFTWKPTYPASIPMVGHGRGFVPAFRNFLGYIANYRTWVSDGYKKYGSQGRAFIVPAAVSRAYDIILPRSQTNWLFEKPDHIVSAHKAHNDILYSDYNFLGKAHARTYWYNHVIHRSLARHLPVIVPGLAEEVFDSVERAFGANTNAETYEAVNLWSAWLRIVPQVTNRMLVGPGTCRDEDFNRSMVSYVDAIAINCFILNMVPRILHPIFGPICTLPNWFYYRKASKVSIPVIKERLHGFERKEAGDPDFKDWTPSEDFITWSIRLAKQAGEQGELDPSNMSKRLLPIQFAAIHTTVLTGHSVMLDLLASDPSKGFLDELREEAHRVLTEEGGQWTKNALSRLYRIDSAIRESQRLSNFSATLVERCVVAENGLTNEFEGWHVPKGTYITFNLEGLHHDPEIYEDPYEYDPFRFSRQREAYEARPADQKDPDEGLKMKRLGMVTTSDAHLAFGHGRHACPGRFFVAHELKLVLAHVLLNYDLQPLGERPKPQWVGATIIPPTDVDIKMKKRSAPWAPSS